MSKKLLIALGSIALVVGLAGAYRAATGQCPVGALVHKLHGDSQATTAAHP